MSLQEWLEMINLQEPTDPWAILGVLAIFFVLSAICLAMILYLRRMGKIEGEREEAEKKAAKNPDSLRQRWDVYLVDYKIFLAMNIRQNRFVFYVALLMIMGGFVLIGAGFVRDAQSQEMSFQSVAVIVAGVITEFIAGTIMIIFRSVVEQTMEHRKTLEKFVSIGIAMNMLDQLPAKVAEQDLKSQTAADLAKLVIAHQLGSFSGPSSSTTATETRN